MQPPHQVLQDILYKGADSCGSITKMKVDIQSSQSIGFCKELYGLKLNAKPLKLLHTTLPSPNIHKMPTELNIFITVNQ
jgi:hypothetical protein